jgi:WD40 repeat protein
VHDAFISYARADAKEFVGRLARALEGAGKDVWVDLDDIPPASRWQEALQEGVLESGAFVFVISPAAIGSEHCRTELEHAVQRNKRVLPVAHLEVPDEEIPAAVASLNWIPQDGAFDDDFDGAIARLIGAIETDQEAVRSHTRWQGRAEGWDAADRDRSLLARGSELAEAEAWLTAQTGREPQPTALQAEWVAAGRQHGSRRRGLALAAALAALAVTAVLGVLALAQRNEAREQRDGARAQALATDAIANLEIDPELSLMLALEAVRTDATQRTEDTLRRALLASRVRTRLAPGGEGGLDAARFSDDGTLIAIAADDGRTTIWDRASGERVAELTVTGSEAPVLDVAFTPDASRVVTAHNDGSARVWDLSSERELERIQLADTTLVTVAVSPDGERIAAGAFDGTAAVADLDGTNRTELSGMSSRVYSIVFDRAGERVLTASGDGFARLWDASSGRALLTMRGHGGPQGDAQFSHDEHQIATANRDGSVVIWDAETGEPEGDPLVPGNRSAFVTRVAFVPGADALAVSGSGGFVEAFDLITGARLASYRGHRGIVVDLAASPEGDQLLTAGGDGTARLWDFSQRVFAVRARAAVFGVDFDSTGERLLFADGRVAIVDAETGKELPGIERTGVAVFGAAFSPDDSLIATGQTGGTVALWDAERLERVQPTMKMAEDPFAVDWSADGSRLLAATFETAPQVFDPANGEVVQQLPRVGDFIFDAQISPDGRRAAIVSGANHVPIFDVETGERVGRLEGHDDRVDHVAYSRDAGTIVTGSGDGTARIWSADTLEPQQLISHDGQPIRSVAISDDGGQVASATAGGELRVWDVDTGLELMRVNGADTSVAIAPGGRLIAGALTQARTRATVSVFECEVCGATTGELEALAEERLTREPTPEERERYLGP